MAYITEELPDYTEQQLQQWYDDENESRWRLKARRIDKEEYEANNADELRDLLLMSQYND